MKSKLIPLLIRRNLSATAIVGRSIGAAVLFGACGLVAAATGNASVVNMPPAARNTAGVALIPKYSVTVYDAVTTVGQRRVPLSAAVMLDGAPLPRELTFDIYVNGVMTESAGIGADGKSFPQDHLMDGLQKPGVLDIEFRTKQIVQPSATSGVVVQTFGSGHGKLTVMKAATTVKNFWARAELHPGIVGEKPYVYMGGNIERITNNKDKAAPGLPIRIKVNGVFTNTATTTPDGSFVTTFELPAHAAGKAYSVEALVDGNDLYLPTTSQTVSVVIP